MSNHLKNLETHAREALKPALEGQLSQSEQIDLYKRFLKVEEHRILQFHRGGAGGLEVAHARAALIDTVLRAIHEASINANKGQALPIALVATGGYGRGTLNPRSDIDLLFLLPRASTKLPPPLQEFIQNLLYLLWDVGFKVGHACRSINECIEEARADQENKTALMDARLIAGDAELFGQFQEKFSKECIHKGQVAFFDLRRQDLRTRHTKYSRTVFLQEPNVKESCGGMRDYQNIQWVALVKRGSRNLKDLVEAKLLTSSAWHELEQAYDFLHRVRNELHYHAEKATDQLTLQLQGVVATAFNYPQKSILRKTEAFMRDYYRHTRNHLSTHRLADGELPDRGGEPVRQRPALLPHLPQEEPRGVRRLRGAGRADLSGEPRHFQGRLRPPDAAVPALPGARTEAQPADAQAGQGELGDDRPAVPLCEIQPRDLPGDPRAQGRRGRHAAPDAPRRVPRALSAGVRRARLPGAARVFPPLHGGRAHAPLRGAARPADLRDQPAARDLPAAVPSDRGFLRALSGSDPARHRPRRERARTHRRLRHPRLAPLQPSPDPRRAAHADHVPGGQPPELLAHRDCQKSR